MPGAKRLILLILASLLVSPLPLSACSLCTLNLRQSPTIRQEAGQETARLIFICTLHNQDPEARPMGTTEMHIQELLRTDPWLGDRKVLVMHRLDYGKGMFLVFSDVYKNQCDPYRGIELKTEAGVAYARKVLKLDPRDRLRQLLFFAEYLEHSDEAVAHDAFLEFAKATDQEIAQAGRKLSPDRLRGWIKNEKTKPDRLGLYCLLLGVCGAPSDADLFQRMLTRSDDRTIKAYDGILGGYMHLRPRQGWQLARSLLADGKKSLDLRLAAARTVSFYHGAQPRESREQVLRCMEAMIVQGELADIAVEDLRRWQMWDYTPQVLGLFGKKDYDAPLMRRAILRYALSCKSAECQTFLTDARRQDGETVKEVEESLQYEK